MGYVPAVTNTFVNGTVADGTAVSQNFTDLVNSITDGNADLTVNSITLSTALAYTEQLVVTVNSAQLKLRFDTSGNTDCIFSVANNGDTTITADGDLNLIPLGSNTNITGNTAITIASGVQLTLVQSPTEKVEFTIAGGGSSHLSIIPSSGGLVGIGRAPAGGYGILQLNVASQSEGWLGFVDSNHTGTPSAGESGWIEVSAGTSTRYIKLYEPTP